MKYPGGMSSPVLTSWETRNMFSFVIKSTELSELTTAGVFADGSRSPILGGVLLEVTRDGDAVTIKATATDSFRLVIIERGGDAFEGIDDGATVTALVNAKGMTAAVKSATKDAGKTGKVLVTVDPEHLRATFETMTAGALKYPAELIDGTYPDVKSVIPAEKFFSESNGVGTIAFNPHFLATLPKLAPWSAKTATDTVIVDFIDTSRPARFRSADRRTMAYLMPVRVR